MHIIKETILNVSDNSGAKTVRCIGLYKGAKIARFGDKIKVVIKTIHTNSNVKRKTISLAIIIRVKKNIRLPNGLNIKFKDNAVVLINENLKPVGNRVFNATLLILKKKYSNITELIDKFY